MKWMMFWAIALLLALSVAVGVSGCTKSDEVVLYTSIDEPVARAVVKRFEAETGTHVVLVTDTEATKTAGLAERVLAERDRPRADVYWGNEPFHTLRLARDGVLEPFEPEAGREVPAQFRDPAGLWTGVGYRMRVIARTTRPADAALVHDIRGVWDLTRPELKGRIGIASPATGTTSGHLAALYVAWGEAEYARWLAGLRANEVKLLGGNAVVARMVGEGTLLAGLTDNDDVTASQESGLQLEAVVPDQPGEGRHPPATASATAQKQPGGTLLVPTTVGLVKAGPNPQAGQKLVAFIAQEATERQLIEARFLAGSLRRVGKGDGSMHAIDVGLPETADAMRTAVELALTVLQDRQK